MRASKTIPSIPTLPMMIPAQRLSGCGSPRRHEVSRNLPSSRGENVVPGPYFCIIYHLGITNEVPPISFQGFRPISQRPQRASSILSREAARVKVL